MMKKGQQDNVLNSKASMFVCMTFDTSLTLDSSLSNLTIGENYS